MNSFDMGARLSTRGSTRGTARRFRRLFEEAPVGIAQAAPDGTIIQVNRKLCELLGYEPEELRGTNYRDFVHPDDVAEDQARARDLLSGRSNYYSAERRFRHKDGREIWATLSCSGARNSAGRLQFIIGTLLDITDMKHMEQELQEMNETLEKRVAERTRTAERRSAQLRLLASKMTQAEERERRRLAQVLHDNLQQLLVGAKFGLSLLSGKLSQREHRKAVRQVDELINQSIDTSRSLSVELSPPILHDGGLIPALHWLARWKEEKYNLSVKVEAEKDAEPHDEDLRVFLFQSVRELLLNVVKHAGVSHAHVVIGRTEEDKVRISVTDGGCGFDAAHSREEDSPTGFGLFSIRERMELLGGQMEIKSGLGKGSHIILIAPRGTKRQPVAGVAAPKRKARAIATGEIPKAALRVLIADDHRILREGLVGLLEVQDDIEIVGEAPDGATAVTLAHSLRPDVIIMDVSMPELSGIEATRRIKEDLPATRVIGLSMHEEADMAAAMREAGATAYLPKGGPVDALISAIRAAAPVA